LAVCERAGIATVGAGVNLCEARRILIRQIGTIRVGVLGVAEHEFSIATPRSAGANPLDIIDFVRNVRENSDRFDYLVVLLHGSDEFHVPTPRVRDTCRFMIEMGARAVVVQHPHVLGGYEYYQGGHIVYGQGALVMDEAIYRDQQSFHEGFLVKLSIAGDLSSRMEIIPFVQSNPSPGARRLTEQQEEELRSRFEQRSKAIADDEFVEAEWLRFCEIRKHIYMSSLLGHNRVVRKLDSGGWLRRLFYSRKALLSVRNCVCCETHREAIETILDRGMV